MRSSPYMDKGRQRAFLKNPLQKESWRTAEPEQNSAKNIDRVANSKDIYLNWGR
jgi:hypothetical protein